MNAWLWLFVIVAVTCLLGFVVFAILDIAKTSGANQEHDEHEEGGIG